MKTIISSFHLATQLLIKDKILLFLSSIPTLIGLGLYAIIGRVALVEGRIKASEYIQSQLGLTDSKGILSTILFAFFTVLLFFLINWTFVLIVSIVAGPFNDIISARTEKLVNGTTPLELSSTLLHILTGFFKTLWNDIKKIIFILFLAILSLLLGFIPFLSPLTILISAILMSIQFLDYNWVRHNVKLRDCIKDLRKGLFGYLILGLIFIPLMAMPIVNLIMLPFGVIVLSIYWTKKSPLSLPIQNS